MLQKTTLPVPLSGALDQKKDFKTQLPGSFILLENVVRTKAERWDKRSGFVSMATNYSENFVGSSPTTGTINAGVYTGTYGLTQLLLADGARLFSYSDVYSAWLSSGYLPATTMTARGVAQGSSTYQTRADTAYVAGYSCSVWQVSSRFNYAVYDDETGAEIVPPKAFASNIGVMRVVAAANGFLFVGVGTGNNIVTGYLATSTITATLSLTTRTITGVTVNYLLPFDVASYDSGTAVFCCGGTNGASPCIGYGRITTAGVYTQGNHITASARTCIGVVGDSASGVFYVLNAGSGTSIIASVVTTSTAAFVTESALFAVTAGSFLNATAVVTTAGHVSGFVQQYGFGSQSSPTMTGTLLSTLSFQYAAGVISNIGGTSGPNLGLVSKAFYDGTHTYAYVAYETVLQPTYFIVRDDFKIVTRFAVSTGGGFWKGTAYESNGTWGTAVVAGLSSVYTDFLGGYTTVLQKRLEETVVGPAPAYQAAVTYNLVRYSTVFSVASLTAGELAGLSYCVKGMPRVYDGQRIVEQGFNFFPEDGITAVAAAGGSLSAATYAYSLVFEATDSLGNVHRSAASPLTTIDVLVNQKVTISHNTSLAYFGDRAVTRYVVYFSAAGEADLLYRVGKGTVGSSFEITTNPNTSGPVLYTAGGVLDNIAAPYASVVHVHKNRVWLGGLENSEIAFSKEAQLGEGVGFPDGFRIPIGDEGGPVTAFGSLDDKLIIFKARSIYFLTGNGPNLVGQNWDYGEPELLPFDVGTSIPNSVVLTPAGLIFKSDKGFFLLDRGLNAKYIGAQIEDYNALTVSSAVLNATQNEARFTTSDGACLVYNYFFGQWYTFTNYTAVSATVVYGTYYHLKANGTVNEESSALHTDNGTAITMALETSWLSLAKLQGYQRIYSLTFLADYVSRCHMKLSLAKDFESTYNQTITVDTNTFISGAILQYRLQPAIQKCEAIKLRIEDIDDLVVGGGLSFRPTGLMVEVGVKHGANKLSASKRG